MTQAFGLSIVVPVYNGANSVGHLVEELSGLAIDGGLEIVLVNDGSPDNSEAVIRELMKTARVPVTLVNHARNFGEHNAVMTGLRHASGDFIITMDDDLQNPPQEVARLWRHARDGNFDVVYTYYADKQHAWWRNLGSRFTNWCADQLMDKPKGVYLSSFRCMSAFASRQVTAYDGPFPYVDGLLMQVTKRIDRLLVEHLPRAEGRSNYNLRRLVRLWMNMFLNFSVMPLRMASLLGMALAAFGGVAVIFVVIEALFFETPQGYASLMAALLLISGAQLAALGMIGEYLGRLYLTANRKPQGVVREVVRTGTAEPPAGVASVDAGVRGGA